MIELSALWLLFSTSFLSATLLPGGSEVNLVYLLNQHPHSALLFIFIATLGNTLGGLVNFMLGRCFPARVKHNKQTEKITYYIERYGYAALLFSWLPLIGDPLCVVAGWLRLKLVPCLFMIALGKALRYCLLAGFVLGFISL